LPPISELLDAIQRYENWVMDLPGLVGVPVLMETVGIPILFVVFVSAWIGTLWDDNEMSKHHCRSTGESREYYIPPRFVGKVMMPGQRGTSYEYSCDDGYRWR